MKDLSVFVFSRKALFLLSSAIAISVVCSCTRTADIIATNWGWHGDSNGWFTPWVINENQGTPTLRSSRPYGEYYDISTFHIWK